MKQFKFNERQRFSIRKFSIGAASVLLGSVFFAVNSVTEVQAMEASSNTVLANNVDQDLGSVPTTQPTELSPSSMNPEEDKNNSESGTVVSPILDSNPKKQALAKLIEEIDGKFSAGAYDEKTEDSVNRLKAVLEEAKATVNSATTEGELTQAHSRLVTATTQLKTKPEEKKEAPAVDTTNGKATVGIKATNTEKAADTNSIANSGSRDERNGKVLDVNNPFRTEAATTNDDPAANQTYTAPAENADLNELKSELLKLPDAVQNNTKIQDMNDLGDQTGVVRGEVKEIQEFGGWKAINQPDGTAGKFAIARKTEAGVFPVETVNTVFTNIRNGQARYYDTYVGEQAFDRSKDYMLFLGKVRTRASESEQTFNGKPYQGTGLGGSDSYAIKSFSGIEKTFKAHSPATGSKVKVAFKTGFTGDLNGTKAKYLVEVVYRQNDSEVTAYTYTFAPQPRATVKNDKGIVTPAKDGTGRAYVRSEFNNYTLNKAEVEAKMAQEANKPNGQAGTFTSSDIDLPVGVTEYTVRIKVTDTDRMGMGYQSPLRHYALPVTGLDFSIEQDTRKLAKNLLQRVYDKLKATEERDIKGKTEETISTYKAQLERVKNLLEGELNPTQTYKDIVNAVLDGQKALRTDKSKLDTSNNKLLDLINETPDPRIGKTPISKEPYNTAKDEAIKAREEAQKILNQDNPDPDIVAAAVSKLNEKLAELKAARAELVVAATEAQKTKLAADKAKLVEASKEGKTQDSINAYEARYNALKSELDTAVMAANDVANAQENASKVSALEAQEKVTEVLAKLEEAKALLKDKATDAQIAELKKAETALTPISDDKLGNKKPTSVQKYKDSVAAIQQELTETKTKVAKLLEKAKTDNAAKEEAAQLISKVDALKSKLTDASTLLEDKANTGGLETAKNELKAAVAEEVTAGKTPETVGSYNTAKQAADEAVKAAEAVLSNPNATQDAVNAALQTVTEKKAALAAAKKALVEAATPEQKTTLATDAAALVPASKEGKTPESITAYEARLQELNGELTAAKQAAEAIAAKGENASKDAAIEAQAKVSAIKAKLADAATLLKDKANTSALETAKNELKAAVAEEVTAGKTPETVGSYNTAKQAADEAVKAAEAVLSNPNATQDAVNAALQTVTEKKAALAAAKKALVEAATPEQKTTLATDAAALVPASKEGKTPESITAYEARLQELNGELTAAKQAAEAIAAKGENASKDAAIEAQAKVSAIKAKLADAATLLKDKANTSALETAKNELKAAVAEEVTAGKTPETVGSYNTAKQAADEAVKAAEAVLSNPNATQDAVNAALQTVTEKKAALAAAKKALVEAATPEQKTTLATDAAALVPASKEGKTPESITAYEARLQELNGELTAAKQAAEAIAAKGENASKDAAIEAQAKVSAIKAKLADAATLLKDKANTSALETAKNELKAAVAEEVTAGKTPETVGSYNTAKQAADEAVKAAEAVLSNPNATQDAVNAALQTVTEKKAALAAAKKALVEAATPEQKTTLATDAAALVPASKEGKTPESITAYEARLQELNGELTAAKQAAEAIAAKGENASKDAAIEAQAKVSAIKAKLADAATLLKDKANTSALETAKNELKEAVAEEVTAGKTPETVGSYNTAKQAADEAVKAAEAVLSNPNATQDAVNAALQTVTEKKAALAAAKKALVEAATPEQKTTLATDAAALVPASKEGKTPESITAYEARLQELNGELTAAKQAAEAIAAKGENASKDAAIEAQAKVSAIKAKLADAATLLKDKANTSALETAKNELKAAVAEEVTAGKTPETVGSYNTAKQAADEAVKAAEAVLSNPNATQDAVNAALQTVTEKKAALAAAKKALVEAATPEQKTTLATDAAALVPASKEGKTPESITAYEARLQELNGELTAAKQAAEAIAAKGENASKDAAIEAQAKVSAIKAKLADAATLLKDKANTSALETAKNELKAAVAEEVTAGKTPETVGSYNTAKQAADEAVKAAEAVLSNPNATQDAVNAALQTVTEKKAALAAAKKALVEAATPEQKTTLATDAAALVPASKEGKTPESITAYEARLQELNGELTAAKQAAEAIAAKGENASKDAAIEAQAKVSAIKAKLADAATLLKDKANTSALETAKNELKEAVAEEVTAGKTPETVGSYNTAKQAADEAVKAAEAVLSNPNATQDAVNAALQTVTEKKAALAAAKKALVEAATPEQKTTLATDAAALVPASKEGKTPESITAYEARLQELNGELTAAKQAAEAIAAKGENASKDAAIEAQAKVSAIKAKLADAATLLKDKANTSALETAKNELKAAVAEEVTAGKTPETVGSYNTAKQAADEAVKAAEAVLSNPNATQDAVNAALQTVTEKKAALAAAKKALVEAATPEQKTTLATDAAALVPASKEGKTPESITAYEARLQELNGELTAAKQAAEAIAAKGENASKDAAIEAQAKVSAIKAKLADAATLLKDKANTSALETAKNELKAAVAEEVTAGKTPETVGSYNTAKQAADEAVKAAEAVLSNPNATQDAVNAALQTVTEKKAALAAAKKALVEAATPEQKTTLATDAAALVPASKEGKTPESITAYEARLQELNGELTAAKQAAEAIAAKGENASKDAAIEAQAKVSAIKAKLADAATLLKDKANTSALETAKNELKAAVAEEVTAGKTPETVGSYNTAKQAADEAVKAAEAVLSNPNATQDAVNAALQTVTEKKAALAAAKKALVEAATPEQKTTLATDAAALVPASKEGKTPESITAYEARLQELNGELTAAKQAAEAIAAKGENASKDAAIEAQAKVSAIKAKLADAATLLKDKANTSALETAKNELKAAVAEEVTAGKTPETVGSYNTAKQAADEAVKAAEAVLSNPNATQDAVNAALQTVTEKKAALAAAKKALVEAATPEQKTTLATDAAALVPASKEGKTPESITAYEARLQELNGELTAAKQAAEAIAAKGENASKDAAIEAQAKVSAIKAKLADAATLLKDKANTSALETAKNELKEAVAEEVTAGKTPETVGSYNTAKQAADEAVKAAEAVLSNPNATQDAVNAALQTVTEKKAALAAAKKALVDKITQDQKDDLANAEENLKLADTTGKAKESVKAYNDEVAKLSDELAAAKQAAKDLLDKGDNAGELEAYRVQAKINKLKSKLAEAAKLLKDIDKSAAKKEVEDAAKKATDAIVANNDLTPEQKEAAKAKVAEEATKAIDAIDKATTEDDVTAASNAGKLGIEKEAAKAEIEAAKAAKEKAIDANDKLSDSEKQAAKEEAAKLADEAKKAIDAATDNAGVDGAKATGTAAVEAVNPVGKEKALDAIQKATEDKLAEIDRDDKLSDKEKDKAKAEVAKAAIDAVNAINEATNQAAVDAKQTEGTKAVSEVNPVGKDKAKAEIEKELAEKTKAIDTNTDLTPEQKADAKAKIAEEAKKAIDAINKATTTEEVASAKESGKLAIEKEAAKAEIEAAKAAKEKAIDANPDLTDEEKAEAKARVEEEAEAAKNAIDKATELSDIDKVTETGKEDIKKVTVTSAKEEAKKAIDKALEEKEKAIDARTDLTQEEKEAAKKAAREEAEAAKNAIDKATTLEDINKVLEDGKENIAKINPETLKDRAKKAIDEALAAKEKAIDARTDLTQEEKEAAKKAAREEAEAAKNAIDKATTLEDINKVLEDGKENIAKINPENLKDKAKKAIDEALAAKEKAIDARTDLLPEEKEAAKKAAREEAEAAKNAIDKATTSEDINKVLEDGKENIANINPVGAKEEAKKAVEEALANKEKEIDESTDLTSEEKVKAKELAREEAKAAKDAIDKATSIEAIEKALRPFLYQIDQDALVFDRPELDIKAALQASITGTVIAERGNVITQAEIIAKLNLPEDITVISIDLPDTTTLGRKFAKVTLRLADGTQATVSVPVEVVEKSEGNHQQNNTQVKPQEVSKPAAEPSKNSEQVEDGKDTPSKAFEEKNSSKQTVLPNTGTTESVVAMIAAAASGLLGLGLAGRRRKDNEEA